MFVLNGNGKRVLDMLGSLGLGEYESRAFFTLAVCGKMKAGRVAKLSGVPVTKVYLTLEQLSEKGLVEVVDGFPKNYVPLSLRVALKSSIASREEELRRMKKYAEFLESVARNISPLVRKHRDKVRIFEPSYKM
jgi:sugar-specific transcriptional regulator TrmB